MQRKSAVRNSRINACVTFGFRIRDEVRARRFSWRNQFDRETPLSSAGTHNLLAADGI